MERWRGLFFGEIILASFERIPRGFLPCDGRILSFRDETHLKVLYSLLGNKWGGDPMKLTFALPDLRDKVPAPTLQYLICCDGVYPMSDD